MIKKPMKEGNVVADFKIGNTRVKICDDAIVSDDEVEKILERISRNALAALIAQEQLKT